MNISFFFSMVQEVLVLNSVSSPGILWADLGPKRNVCEHKLESRFARTVGAIPAVPKARIAGPPPTEC
jgi:hypothetical protein